MLVTNQTNQDYWFGPLHLAAGVGQTLTVDDTTADSLYLKDDAVADAINFLYATGKITVSSAAAPFPRPTGTPEVLHGDGSPEGLVFAGQGSIFLRRDVAGGAQLYQKTTGIQLNTGWAAIVTSEPTGSILAYAGTNAPSGYLLCDGSAVSRTTYSVLFTLIGTTYGAGDGSTTFNVPDLRGRAAVGYAASGGHADVSALANNEGVALASRRPKHDHTITRTANVTLSDPGHNHELRNTQGSGSMASEGARDNGYYYEPSSPPQISVNTTGISVAQQPAFSVGPQTGAEPNDAPAYLVLNYIIKT